MKIPWAGERVWLLGVCNPKDKRQEGREASMEHKDTALAFRALLFCPFPPGEGAHCGSPKGTGSYSRSQSAPTVPPQCLGSWAAVQSAVTEMGVLSWLPWQVLPATNLHVLLPVLKSFFVFLQMWGSLGQRFSTCQRLLEQVTPHIPVPRFPQGLQLWRAGGSVDLSISFVLFSLKTKCNSCWEAEASGHTITPCSWAGERAV